MLFQTCLVVPGDAREPSLNPFCSGHETSAIHCQSVFKQGKHQLFFLHVLLGHRCRTHLVLCLRGARVSRYCPACSTAMRMHERSSRRSELSFVI